MKKTEFQIIQEALQNVVEAEHFVPAEFDQNMAFLSEGKVKSPVVAAEDCGEDHDEEDGEEVEEGWGSKGFISTVSRNPENKAANFGRKGTITTVGKSAGTGRDKGTIRTVGKSAGPSHANAGRKFTSVNSKTGKAVVAPTKSTEKKPALSTQKPTSAFANYQKRESVEFTEQELENINTYVENNLQELSNQTMQNAAKKFSDRSLKKSIAHNDKGAAKDKKSADRLRVKAAGYHEEFENLDELSKATLKSYRGKAKRSADSDDEMAGHLDSMGMASPAKHLSNKADKRRKGISRSMKNEENLDELSKATLKSYRGKAKRSADDDAETGAHLDSLGHGSTAKRFYDKSLKRQKGISRSMKNEENLDELSKATLKSYRGKAKRSADSDDEMAGHLDSLGHGSVAKRLSNKADQRRKGISRSMKNEENIQELSRKMLTRAAEVAQHKSDLAGDESYYGSKSERKKSYDKTDKHQKQHDKFRNAAMTKEEVTIENFNPYAQFISVQSEGADGYEMGTNKHAHFTAEAVQKNANRLSATKIKDPNAKIDDKEDFKKDTDTSLAAAIKNATADALQKQDEYAANFNAQMIATDKFEQQREDEFYKGRGNNFETKTK